MNFKYVYSSYFKTFFIQQDLGKRDLERERIYLVCNVIRNGAMYVKEVDYRRSSMSSGGSFKASTDTMRRAFGVAAKDVTGFLSGTLDCDLEQEYAIPFVKQVIFKTVNTILLIFIKCFLVVKRRLWNKL